MSLYEYNAKVKRIIDGDTVDAYVDLGFKTHLEIRIRLKGIDTPESRTRDLIFNSKLRFLHNQRRQ